jgi:hypothetical protein
MSISNMSGSARKIVPLTKVASELDSRSDKPFMVIETTSSSTLRAKKVYNEGRVTTKIPFHLIILNVFEGGNPNGRPVCVEVVHSIDSMLNDETGEAVSLV